MDGAIAVLVPLHSSRAFPARPGERTRRRCAVRAMAGAITGLHALSTRQGLRGRPRPRRRQRAPRRDVRRDVPELPPVDESIWKPMPVSEEELKAAMVVDEHSSVASVADAVWAGGAALFVHRWAQLAAVRKALNAAADAEEARAEHPAGTEPVERFRVRRKRLRACARRLYVRVASNGRLGVDGGPRLGYVPVLYANHPFDLAFRANDVAALNVAWQFFVNGLDYSFLSRPLHPFFGVYFTLSPTDHFRLVDDWLKCWTPPSHRSRVLDLGTGCGALWIRQHFSREEVSIVASDRCPNACFSVSAELWRQARSDESSGDLGIQVKHSELFEELEEEGPFDLIIFNPPWVPRALDHDAAENDVVFGNDYPPKLFEKLFEEVPKVLQPSGHLLVLFSNYALCRKLVEVSPMELGTRRTLDLQGVQRRPVEEQKRSRFRQTRRDKAWTAGVPHEVELWDFMAKSAEKSPYFSRRVVEAGELCCKHWLAVQVARRCGMGVKSTTSMAEDEFVEWSQKRLLGVLASTNDASREAWPLPD
ncbi:unnamed protein product [Durusdinium trenchii]|uniref:Methyltransferase small domain-containing protein n=1 Tax=Durusdinium trenchii TaxID=1381693 RepID=A0ABP0PX27_9DINO